MSRRDLGLERASGFELWFVSLIFRGSHGFSALDVVSLDGVGPLEKSPMFRSGLKIAPFFSFSFCAICAFCRKLYWTSSSFSEHNGLSLTRFRIKRMRVESIGTLIDQRQISSLQNEDSHAKSSSFLTSITQ